MPSIRRLTRRQRAPGRLFLGVSLNHRSCAWRSDRARGRRIPCFVIIFLSIIIARGAAHAQTATGDSALQERAVKVFLDVPIDADYVKTRMPFVNYVRDRFDADVHIMVTTLTTAIGGMEYTAHFTGQKSFAGLDDTLRYVSRPTESEEVRRTGLINVLKMGMMRYVARSPLASGMVIYYRYRANPADLIDPWDYWHFSTSMSGYLNGDENDRGGSLYSYLSARRVTPTLKVSVSGSYSYSRTRMSLPSKVLTYIRRYNELEATVVKSLGDHWSAGGYASVTGASYGRVKTKLSIAPAVEYDVFPYAEITTKEFRFLYTIRYVNAVYHEVTIFDKTSENLFNEDLTINLDVKKNWGTVGGSVEASHYLHDASKYRFRASLGLSIELFSGFTFDVGGNYARIHDEIDTPRGRLTDEQILLGLQQMASSYNYSFNIGFSYNFGSKFANIVNRRFGTSY